PMSVSRTARAFTGHFFDNINVTYMNGLAVPWMGWPGNGVEGSGWASALWRASLHISRNLLSFVSQEIGHRYR
ncbi:hypothetical protein, partial [Delftia acidovorans]|uniref:hypothetical protein n=1 Tax=Delftia acidovorans TaxID=80866 RepID=UPI00241FDD85